MGAGSNGLGGTFDSPGGKGGSGGAAGSTTKGGDFGGGAGGRIATTLGARVGGSGACRIIWGAGRAFPSTNTADVGTPGPAPVPTPTPEPTPTPTPTPPPTSNKYLGKKGIYQLGEVFKYPQHLKPGEQTFMKASWIHCGCIVMALQAGFLDTI
jgi:hypothetical protein